MSHEYLLRPSFGECISRGVLTTYFDQHELLARFRALDPKFSLPYVWRDFPSPALCLRTIVA